MLQFLISCVTILMIIGSVQSSAIHRKYRQLDVPIESLPSEVTNDLKKRIVPLEVDIVQPVMIVKEELLVPVENLRNVEPSPNADEPIAVINEIQSQPQREVQNELSLESDLKIKSEQEFNEEMPILVNEQEEEASDRNESLDGNDEAIPALKQNNENSTTTRPNIFQQLINNNPIGQFIDTIRRPLASTGAPGAEGVEATTNINLLQQFQTSVQNIGSQLTSVFIPNQNNAESTPRPPNLIESFQTNLQNVVNNVFRPPGEIATGGTNQGPLQAVISNVQSFFTGNRVAETTTQVNKPTSVKPQENNPPVNDKIDQTGRNSEEIKEAEEESTGEIVVGETDENLDE